MHILPVIKERDGDRETTTTTTTNICVQFLRQVVAPRVSFSTSLLQRCKQLSSTLSSSSVMCRGAGCIGRSGGRRDWVKGLCMGTLCCWATAGAGVGPEAEPEVSRGGKESCSTMLQIENTVKLWRPGTFTKMPWIDVQLINTMTEVLDLCTTAVVVQRNSDSQV